MTNKTSVGPSEKLECCNLGAGMVCFWPVVNRPR